MGAVVKKKKNPQFKLTKLLHPLTYIKMEPHAHPRTSGKIHIRSERTKKLPLRFADCILNSDNIESEKEIPSSDDSPSFVSTKAHGRKRKQPKKNTVPQQTSIYSPPPIPPRSRKKVRRTLFTAPRRTRSQCFEDVDKAKRKPGRPGKETPEKLRQRRHGQEVLNSPKARERRARTYSNNTKSNQAKANLRPRSKLQGKERLDPSSVSSP